METYSLRSPPKTSQSYGSLSHTLSARRARDRRRNRSRSRRPGRQITSYKKLLWVKHPFPDNYTDEKTFLDHLERGRRELYEFWPLVADSMVIVQQVCAVVVFVCCFSGVIQERVSSTTVVACGTLCTGLGWVLWDRWVGRDVRLESTSNEPHDDEDDNNNINVQLSPPPPEPEGAFSPIDNSRHGSIDARFGLGLGLDLQPSSSRSGTSSPTRKRHTPQPSNSSMRLNRSPLASSFSSTTSLPELAARSTASIAQPLSSANSTTTQLTPPPPPTRTADLLTTLKSALLIHTTLLALSPLLKSLTKSTASDSIWALSICLMALNIFFFDYTSYVPSSTAASTQPSTSTSTTLTLPATSAGAPVNAVGAAANFPASLSTNAGLMASTVLASRLSDTLAVFSLTLFSIEVFGLFPVFRRVLRQRWWRGHVGLTLLLVAGAGAGVAGVTSSATGSHEASGWRGAIGRWLGGAVLGGCCVLGSMGVAAWWLIGLQQYKDEMSGPWDVARPVLRRRWD